MANSTLEMRRLVGKFAFLFAGIYLLVVFGAAVSAATGDPPPLVAWPLLLVPAAAFVVAVLDAVRLHRSNDPAVTGSLWRRCLLYTAIGMVLLIVAALYVEQMTAA